MSKKIKLNSYQLTHVAISLREQLGVTMFMVLSAGAVLAWALSYFLVLTFWSPLSIVPSAHWSARYSSLWIIWTRYNGRELSSLMSAHKEHGAILLVGPRDLSVHSFHDGVRKVYDTGFPKPGAFYAPFQYFGYFPTHFCCLFWSPFPCFFPLSFSVHSANTYNIKLTAHQQIVNVTHSQAWIDMTMV